MSVCKLFMTLSFTLFTDNETIAALAAVSPAELVLHPPEKLVIEVESSGGYFRHAWYRNDEELYPNGDNQFTQETPERFAEFFQVFVQDPTTSSDHGVYRVELIDDSFPVANVFETVEFIVAPSGGFAHSLVCTCTHTHMQTHTHTYMNTCTHKLICIHCCSISECGSSQYHHCDCC